MPPPPPPPPSGSVMSGDERAERRAADLHIPRLMCKEAPQVGGGGGGQPWRAPPWRFRTRGSSPRGSNPSWWSVKPAGCSSGSPQRVGSEPRATKEHCALMENRTITAPPWLVYRRTMVTEKTTGRAPLQGIIVRKHQRFLRRQHPDPPVIRVVRLEIAHKAPRWSNGDYEGTKGAVCRPRQCSVYHSKRPILNTQPSKYAAFYWLLASLPLRGLPLSEDTRIIQIHSRTGSKKTQRYSKSCITPPCVLA